MQDRDTPLGSGTKKDSPALLILLGLGLMAFGVWAAYRVGIPAWDGFASFGWSKTEGRVLQSNLSLSIGSRSGKHYNFEVVYSYSAAGEEYKGNRISPMQIQGGGDEAYARQQLNNKYPRGNRCTVYYDPKDPTKCCLEQGVSYFHLVLFSLLTPLFFVGGFYLMRSGWIDWKRTLAPSPKMVCEAARDAHTM